ncbi:MAG: DUF805 domain-containing protein [Pseudomonadota bacterium]
MSGHSLGMVFDPRGRITRRLFVWDLIIPNVVAVIAIVLLRVMAGPIAPYGIAAVSLLLLWAAYIAAPIARFHDVGLSGKVHLVILVVIILFTVVGPLAPPGEMISRVGSFVSAIDFQGGGDLPQVDGRSASIGALIAFLEVLFLALWKGNKGENRYGPDPRAKDKE